MSIKSGKGEPSETEMHPKQCNAPKNELIQSYLETTYVSTLGKFFKYNFEEIRIISLPHPIRLTGVRLKKTIIYVLGS